MKTMRKAKGLSQDDLALELGVVRQTVSKWERGLSVPDAQMLIRLSEVFDTRVSMLLGENIIEKEADEMEKISEKLEITNSELAHKKEKHRTILLWILILLCVATVAIFIALASAGSPYLSWNYHDPETAVLGVICHGFEWIFMRLAPFIFAGTLAGSIFLIMEKDDKE
ncbi:helix-turn-helix domain-containing protein [Alloscardovia venturai]